MPRRKLVRTKKYPYHITIRSHNKEWFELSKLELWTITQQSLKYAYKRFKVDLHAFVLMDNHYHMIISTPDENIDSFMCAFNSCLGRKMKVRTRRINQKFGGRYSWSLVTNDRYLFNVFRYVYQNPLKAELVDKCEEYDFSTLKYEVEGKKFIIPLSQKLPYESKDLLNWFNYRLNMQERAVISLGLKKGEFSFSKSNQNIEIQLCSRLP